MFSLIIDNRERALFSHIEANIKNFHYEKMQLSTGDYLIIENASAASASSSSSTGDSDSTNCSTNDSASDSTNCSSSASTGDRDSANDSPSANIEEMTKCKIRACIERKTYTDLAASFRDGRYKSEVENMLKMRAETNCQLFFIIEGTAFPAPTSKFSRISYGCILGAINKLMLRDGIFIIQTKNEAHTAVKLHELLTTIKIIYDEETKANPVIGGAELKATAPELKATLTKRHIKSDKDICLRAWSSLEGISLEFSKVLITKFSMRDLIAELVPISDLTDLKTAFGRKIHKDALNSLLLIRSGSHPRCAIMLSAIVGITFSYATYLLKAKNIKDIISDDLEKLSDTTIEGKKLGVKKAENIIKLLNYKLVHI
jgi:ERCC4-type nuclease